MSCSLHSNSLEPKYMTRLSQFWSRRSSLTPSCLLYTVVSCLVQAKPTTRQSFISSSHALECIYPILLDSRAKRVLNYHHHQVHTFSARADCAILFKATFAAAACHAKAGFKGSGGRAEIHCAIERGLRGEGEREREGETGRERRGRGT